MVAQGAVKGVQAILAFHVDPNLPVGHVSITPGPQSAFCQDFTIEVRGKGGHGARPHNTIDPIAVAAQLVTLIYQAVPRQTDARDPVVVTIGMIQGGQAPNIIPDTVVMKGTIRSFDQACQNMPARPSNGFVPEPPALFALRSLLSLTGLLRWCYQ